MFQVNNEGRLILTKDLKDLLNKIQKQGNKDVTYKTDKDNYGIEEKWAYPKVDGFKLYGDCEDIALYKRRLLIEAGVPKEPLLMTICLDPSQNGHCVLDVITDKQDIVLCNAHTGLTTPGNMQSEGYRFLYRQALGKGIDVPFDVLK